MARRQPRRMVDPDYAGQVRAGIGAKMNGQMTSSNSFKAFQTPMGGGFTKAQGEQFEKNRLDLMFPNAGPSSVKRNVDKAGRALFDFSGFGTNPQGNFGVDPLTLGLTLTGIGPFGKLIGRVGKALIPASARIAGAAGRVSSNAQKINRAREAASRVARSDARDTIDRAADLRKPTFIGSDFYETSSKQVDALYDKWETTSSRVGQAGGPSAWQRAQDAAAATGRTVVRTGNDDIPGRAGETFRLRPTSSELDLAEQLDRGAGALVRQADDLARNQARFAGNPAAAAREIERRLKALKTTPVRREPWRTPRNPAL